MTAARPTSSSSDDVFTGQPLDEHVSIVFQVVGFVVLVFGFLGNDLLLVILFRRRQEKRFRNAFILNLAVADLVVLCYCMPLFLLDLSAGHHPFANQTWCRISGFVVSVSYATSVLSVVMISCQRYVKVCHRPLFRTFFTTTRSRCICLALWALALLLNLPILAKLVPPYGYDPRSHLCNARASRRWPDYGSVAMVCLLLVPVLLIVFFNGAIFTRWSGSRRKLKPTRTRQKASKATWKSFLSLSLDNIATLEEGDSRADNPEPWRGSRHREDDRLPDLIFPVTESDSEDDMPQLDRPQSSRPFLQGCARNGRSRHFLSWRRKSVRSRKPVPGGEPSSAPDASFHREKESLTLQATRRRASLLCEALDLDTPVLVCPNPTNPKVRDARLDSPVRKTSFAAHHGNDWSPLRQTHVSPKPSNSSGLKFSGLKEIPPSPTRATCGWNVLEEVNGNCEPAHVVLSRPTSTSGWRSLYPSGKNKSLYPSIDRTRHFLSWRRKSAHCGKPARSEQSVVRSLLVICAVVFVLYTPFAITLLLTFLLPEDPPTVVSVTSTLLLFVNCAVNWVVYGALNTAYRQAYVSTLTAGFRCLSRRFRRSTPSPASAGLARYQANKRLGL